VGGGGGGSGGALHLTAIVARLEGTLTALGAPGAEGTGGSIGGAGSEGRIRLDTGVLEALADVQPAPGFQGALACLQ
jgi:hypothetical protein